MTRILVTGANVVIHGLDSAAHPLMQVIEYKRRQRDWLINLYNPLLGDYPGRLQRLEHPFVTSRIVD